MTQTTDREQEVSALEFNATEGARIVLLRWMVDYALLPLCAVYLVLVIGAFASGGILAAALSAAVFGVPLFFLLRIGAHQGRKVGSYWAK